MKKLLICSLLIYASVQYCRADCTAPAACEVQETPFMKQFKAIETKIRQLYDNEVFYTSKDPDFRMEEICTGDFIRRLADAYEYDGEGYATWLLRSGAQDGEEDCPSAVLSVDLGAEDHTVTVRWTDMGQDGATTFRMVQSDGRWLIDDCTVPVGFPPL